MNSLKLIWLNVSFYILLVLFTLVAVPTLALFVAWFALTVSQREARRRFRRAISWYGYVIITVLPRPLIRFRYEDHASGAKDGPQLYVCNHRSSSDPFLMACLPGECIQIVNAWPMRLPVWGPMARLAGYLSINEMPVEEFFRRAAALLGDGVSIIAFPEGTRSGGYVMGPFHGTIFRLALQSRVPIVPLCISGNERTPPRGTMLLYPGLIRVRRLPALTWDDYHELTPFQLKNRVRDLIAAELDRMENRT